MKLNRRAPTREEIFLSLVQNTRRAIRTIDVKPEIEFSCDVRDLVERIDDAGVYSARTANDAKRSQAFAKISLDLLSERVDAHSLAIVARNHTHLIASEAENVSRLRDRHVNFFRSVNGHRRPGIPKPLPRCIQDLRRFAIKQRDHVGHRAAAGQKAFRLIVVTDQRSQPAHDEALELQCLPVRNASR